MKDKMYFLLLISLIFSCNSKVSSGDCKEENFLATSEYVKITGRYYQNDDITWLIHSGSAIEFYATGKSVTLILAGGNAIYNDEKYRPRYGVYLDDKIIEDSISSKLEHTVTIFESEEEITGKVKVMLLSENNNGGIGVKNIVVNACHEKSVLPLEKKTLSIEFIGDSITCAYGVEGASQYENFKTSTENFSKSYAYLTAQKLDADYSTFCLSGHGIVSGYSTGTKNSDSLIPDFYTKLGRNPDYPGDWDFKSNPNDVIIINLGTNDNNYVTAEPDTRNDEFIQGYADFLTLVRKNNPNSYIICTVGIMGCEAMYPLIEKAIQLLGDDKISSYQSPTQNMDDGLGADWHPSEITQQKNSYILADKICNAIGRESDQVGLDVAANAVYNVTSDKEKGVYVSFYVGYDKSFWINMSTGGSSPDAVEATISGIALKAGGVYRLEFDHNSSPDSEIPFVLRGNKEYYTDSITTTSTKTHYSAEIEIKENDSNTQIVFLLGGRGQFQFTLSNIFMTKLK